MEPCGLIHAGQVPLWELVFREFPCGYALSQLQETTMSLGSDEQAIIPPLSGSPSQTLCSPQLLG